MRWKLLKGVKRALSSGRKEQGAVAQFGRRGVADINELFTNICG
jgi:hypothetical protein